MYSIKQQGDTVQTYVIEAVGSTCLVIEDSSVWILGNDLIWHELG